MFVPPIYHANIAFSIAFGLFTCTFENSDTTHLPYVLLWNPPARLPGSLNAQLGTDRLNGGPVLVVLNAQVGPVGGVSFPENQHQLNLYFLTKTSICRVLINTYRYFSITYSVIYWIL